VVYQLFYYLFVGLQNYKNYNYGLPHAKSGVCTKTISLVVGVLFKVIFVVGPEIATYIPSCIAETLLLHIRIDLFFDGADPHKDGTCMNLGL
jgi:sulfate permease, SulP family